MFSEADVLKLFVSCSNLGRWGSDDERGTLNYIDDAKHLEAARLVRHGRALSVGRDLSACPSAKNPLPYVHRMLFSQHHRPYAAIDTVEIAPHGWDVTHLDAPGHIFAEERMYNGRNVGNELTAAGLRSGSIMAYKEGIFTRGVLLDVARSRKLPWLEPSDAVTVEDLLAAEEASGVRIGRGDAVIVRVGAAARDAALGEGDPGLAAGLGPDCIPWIFEREVAVYTGDCQEQTPSGYEALPYPLHQVGMVAMGLVMLDNLAVEPLASLAHTLGRYEFLFTCAPLRIPAATGSAVNPLCVF